MELRCINRKNLRNLVSNDEPNNTRFFLFISQIGLRWEVLDLQHCLHIKTVKRLWLKYEFIIINREHIFKLQNNIHKCIMVSTAWNFMSAKFICTIDIAAHGSYSHYQNQYTLMRIILVLKNIVVMDNL